MKLSFKVVLIFLFSVLFSLSTMAVISIHLAVRQSKEDLKNTADLALSSLSRTITQDLENAFSHIETAIKDPGLQSLINGATPPGAASDQARRDLQDYFSYYLQFNSHYKHMYVGFTDGSIIIDRDLVMPEGYTTIVRPWFLSGKADPAHTQINNIYRSIPDGIQVASISRGILDNSGRFAAVIGIDFLFNRYLTIMQKLAFQPGFIVILLNDNSVIANTRNPAAGFTPLSRAVNADLRVAHLAENGSTVRIEGAPYTVYARTVPGYKLKILTFVSERAILKARTSQALLYLATALVLILLFGLSGAWYTRNLIRMEQAVMQTKTKFFQNMNHEIRTPLNALTGFLDLLSASPLDAESVQHLRYAKMAATHLSDLTNDVLDLSKIHAGKYKIHHIPYAPETLIREVCDLIRPVAQKKGLSLRCFTLGRMPATLSGDPMRLRQILLNLLQNAVKFTRKGHVTLHAEFQEEKDSIRLVFSVSDTGPGIREEQMGLIFHEFTQFSESETPGTGLGLSLVKRLVELMEGEISCESTMGKGTVFRFYLPQKTADTEPMSPEPKRPPQIPVRRKDANILIVEDDPLSRKMLVAYCRQHQLSCHTVTSGNAFLDFIRKDHNTDLILTDMKLPDISGADAVRQLQATGYTLPPVVVCSASDRESVFDPKLFVDHLRKPIATDRLRELLTQWIPAAPAEKKAPFSDAFQKYGADLFRELLAAFCDDHKTTLSLLEAYHQKGALRDMEVRVHRLKGALLNIGCHKVAKMAEEMETKLAANQSIKEKEISALKNALDPILAQAEKTLSSS